MIISGLDQEVADAIARAELERAMVENQIREVPPMEVLLKLIVENATARSEADVSGYLRTGLKVRRIIELLYEERIQVKIMLTEKGYET